jgi:hypothetical protein
MSSELVDKRGSLSEKQLEHMRRMREKAAEVRKQKAEQKRLLEEESAKQEVLEELNKPEVPEVKLQPQDEPVMTEPKKPKRKPESMIFEPNRNGLSLTDEDLSLVRDFVKAERERKKAQKWQNRKKEILADIFNILDGDSQGVDDNPPRYNNLSIFDC